MSQFASITELAKIGGRGEGFNQTFQQERALTADALRRRQLGQQAVQAEQDRQVRLGQLAFENESNRIQQAMAAQKEQANQARQEREETTQGRQRDLANAFKERDLERMEASLAVSQQGEERLQQREERIAQPPAVGSKEFNKQMKDLNSERLQLVRAIDPLEGVQLNDEQRLQIQNRLEEIDATEELLRAGSEAAANNAAAAAQARQGVRAVTQKESGPVLEATLEASGQSRVLEVPTNTETGRPDTDKTKIGKVYQTPKGPAIRMPGGKWEVVDEMSDIVAARQIRNREPGRAETIQSNARGSASGSF